MFQTRLDQLTYALAPASQHAQLIEFTRRAPVRMLQFASTLQHTPAGQLIVACALRQQSPLATLIVHPTHPQIGWIRGCAISGISGNQHHALITQLLTVCATQSDVHTWFFSSDIYDFWLRDCLIAYGFEADGSIITLEATSWQSDAPPLSDGLILRPMTPYDVAYIPQLDAQAFAPQWHKTPHEIDDLWRNPGLALVVTDHERIVAYTMAVWHDHHDALHVVRIAVHPTWQRRGIARHLLGYVGQHASDLGAQRITLNTQHDNDGAIALYRSMGFVPTTDIYPVFRYTQPQDVTPS